MKSVRSLLSVLLFVSLLLGLCACTMPEYTLTFECKEDVLFAPLDATYAAGERVELQLKAPDYAEYAVKIDGLAVTRTEKKEDHWVYPFIMPAKNATLSVEVNPASGRPDPQRYQLNVVLQDSTLNLAPESVQSGAYAAGEELEFLVYCYNITAQSVEMLVDGESAIFGDLAITSMAGKPMPETRLYSFRWTMPERDCTVTFRESATGGDEVSGPLSLLLGWSKSEFSESTVKKVRYTTGSMGTDPTVPATVLYTSHMEDISAMVNMMGERAVLVDRDDDYIPGGSYYDYTFYTESGEYSVRFDLGEYIYAQLISFEYPEGSSKETIPNYHWLRFEGELVEPKHPELGSDALYQLLGWSAEEFNAQTVTKVRCEIEKTGCEPGFGSVLYTCDRLDIVSLVNMMYCNATIPGDADYEYDFIPGQPTVYRTYTFYTEDAEFTVCFTNKTVDRPYVSSLARYLHFDGEFVVPEQPYQTTTTFLPFEEQHEVCYYYHAPNEESPNRVIGFVTYIGELEFVKYEGAMPGVLPPYFIDTEFGYLMIYGNKLFELDGTYYKLYDEYHEVDLINDIVFYTVPVA